MWHLLLIYNGLIKDVRAASATRDSLRTIMRYAAYPPAPSLHCSAVFRCRPESAYARPAPRAGEVLSRHGDGKFRCRTDLILRQRQHVRHAIHHDADHAMLKIQHDHHGVFVVLHVRLRTSARSPRCHALDELRRVSEVDNRHNHARLVTPLMNSGVLAIRVT